MYKIQRSRYAAYLLHVHIVFVTKYRRRIFGELHLAALHQYVAEICQDFGAELKECDGEADHAHGPAPNEMHIDGNINLG